MPSRLISRLRPRPEDTDAPDVSARPLGSSGSPASPTSTLAGDVDESHGQVAGGRDANGELLDLAHEVLARAGEVVIGKDAVVREVFATLIAGGHVLLEDVPGVGKTTLALAFSKLIGLDCTRLQLTPDVMPSDITGFSVYQRDEDGRGSFVYQQGAAFCNLLLADEINRTSPKTQSALLEAMEERSVTVDGVTRDLPRPFFVIATQNPLGSAGTQPLPLSQLDRFMTCMSLGYPDFASEVEMARGASSRQRTAHLERVIDAGQLAAMQRAAEGTFLHDEVLEYAVRLVAATRSHPRLAAGASPRATISLVRMARSASWLAGEPFVSPATVERQFGYVVCHRIALRGEARLEGAGAREVLADICAHVTRPRLSR